MIKALNDAWIRFWFSKEEPTNLAICRILFFAGTLLYYVGRDFSAWGDLPSFVHEPESLPSKLGLLPVLSSDLIWIVEWGWKLALLTSCIGLLTRCSTVMAAGAGLYLLTLPNDFGKVNHNDQPLVLIMFVLAFSRCGDALSVDRWLGRSKGSGTPARSGEYRWPVRAVWVVMSLIFFAAGLSKLLNGGLAWLEGGTLRYHLVSHQYPFLSFPPWTDWGLIVARFPLLCTLLAIGTVGIEFLFPLVLLHPWFRFTFVLSAFCMQLGIRALLGPHFEQYALGYLFFVPWGYLLGGRLKRHPEPEATLA